MLFAAILGAHPSGQLKLFKFIPEKLWEGRFNLKPAFTTRSDDAACRLKPD
jgi:hypothetical protein